MEIRYIHPKEYNKLFTVVEKNEKYGRSYQNHENADGIIYISPKSKEIKFKIIITEDKSKINTNCEELAKEFEI